MREGSCGYKVMVLRPEGRRPLGRPRCRREDNIKMDLAEIGINGEQLEPMSGFCEHDNEP
ncbi:hypothetical protein L798_08070 [Zootermopsis nevadensis]|uniref:Uncharacterized protein n=1 Tax=Zootermopsis nevadensis TaxID=136037 RepID=A0A067RG10_ZOONE|nr:hypothetical protein L798_08070 [Zootermopsis nevadensis]